MQYVEIAKIVIAVLAFLVELIKDIKAEKAGETSDSDAAVDKGLDLLGSIGTVGKIDELKSIDLKAFAPEVKNLVNRLRELHGLRKDQ